MHHRTNTLDWVQGEARELVIKHLAQMTICSYQGHSQDFSKGTHNSPNRFARATKTSLAIKMKCALFFQLFHVYFRQLSLKWKIQVNFPTESWGLHPSSDSERKLNLFLCSRPPNIVAKGTLRWCSYRL